MMIKPKVSIVKSNEAHSRSFSLQTTSKLSNPPKKEEKSYEEQVMEQAISSVEKTRLQSVFEYICQSGQPNQTTNGDTEKGFSSSHLINIFQELDYYLLKSEIDMLIWEVDEDGDSLINNYEFQLMYKRCIFDKTYLEPRNLFNMVQFLMYDKGVHGKITVEDTLELLYVRVGRYNLDQEIYSIFGPEEKTAEGSENSLNFREYLDKMRKKDFIKRKELQVERKTVKLVEEK